LRWGSISPLNSISKGRGTTINSGKIRLLFVRPHADNRILFYGANFEFSYNAKQWDRNRCTPEIRPIIGWHLHPVDIVPNPILDNSWIGGFENLDLAPETRVAYNFPSKWAIAAEEYADFGPLHRFYSASEQSHQIYGVLDHGSRFLDLETGVGFRLTGTSDQVTLKLILSRDLNSRSKN
jgi:hypothetical protein